MTETVPPRVHNAAEGAGFGPLVQRFRHPNGRLFAVVTWAYFAMVAGLLVFTVASVVRALAGRGPDPQWTISVIFLLVTGAGSYLLANLAIGNVTRRAIYLYRRGYVATGPSGRVIRTVPWDRLSGIDGMGSVQLRAQVAGTKARTLFAFRHLGGWPRPIKFSEVTGREQLAPLAYQLYVAAAGPDRLP